MYLWLSFISYHLYLTHPNYSEIILRNLQHHTFHINISILYLKDKVFNFYFTFFIIVITTDKHNTVTAPKNMNNPLVTSNTQSVFKFYKGFINVFPNQDPNKVPHMQQLFYVSIYRAVHQCFTWPLRTTRSYIQMGMWVAHMSVWVAHVGMWAAHRCWCE